MTLPTYVTSTTQTKAYRLLREHVYAVLSEYGLTPTHWSMLGIITEARDGVRHVEISDLLHVKPPLVTAMTKQLLEQGMIRSVQNQFDARAKLLALSPTGKLFVKNVEAAMNIALGKLLVGLTEQDLITYQKVLTTIIANDELLRSNKLK